MIKSNNKDYILVIVESPAKATTINKYLGKEYKVASSMGHIIDLPKSRLGVDIENNFEPEYITIRGKGKILEELKKLASNSKMVLLASDNDREGEAIAYLIKDALIKKIPNLNIKRIVFNEITKPAIIEAIKNPMDIEQNKVNAQKTRRVLDRIVGYYISPLLWDKVKNGLSAGRVQSAALRAICEREEERDRFIPEEYWTVGAFFKKQSQKFYAELFKINQKNPELKNKKEVEEILNNLNKENFIVSKITESTKSIKPQPPFITSKLQQVANTKLNFNARKTMQIAQQLYEGINIGEERVGLITYMRTDSTRISPLAIEEVRRFISENYPEALPEKPNFYTKSETAQDAHEAIRPTSVYRKPEDIKKYLTEDQYKLYSIIWERFVASQMTNAEYQTRTVLIENNNVIFKTSKSTLIKAGFNLCLSKLKQTDEDEEKEDITKILPELKEGEKVELIEYKTDQHFTQPPPRYTDASLVKFLEENGIGRPSTYAPTISTLIDRFYVIRKSKQLVPTMLGKLVNKIVCENFPDIVDLKFTAKMEEDLDGIEKGETNGVELLKNFYSPFKEKVDLVYEKVQDHKKAFDEETGEKCEKCGRPMIKKLGRFGFFLACSGFPECKNSKAIPLADCPKDGCGGKIIAKRKSKGSREFYGCTNYPQCDFITWDKPTEHKCPKCSKFLVEKSDKIHGDYKVCIDPNCGHKQLIEN